MTDHPLVALTVAALRDRSRLFAREAEWLEGLPDDEKEEVEQRLAAYEVERFLESIPALGPDPAVNDYRAYLAKLEESHRVPTTGEADV